MCAPSLEEGAKGPKKAEATGCKAQTGSQGQRSVKPSGTLHHTLILGWAALGLKELLQCEQISKAPVPILYLGKDKGPRALYKPKAFWPFLSSFETLPAEKIDVLRGGGVICEHPEASVDEVPQVGKCSLAGHVHQGYLHYQIVLYDVEAARRLYDLEYAARAVEVADIRLDSDPIPA